MDAFETVKRWSSSSGPFVSYINNRANCSIEPFRRLTLFFKIVGEHETFGVVFLPSNLLICPRN